MYGYFFQVYKFIALYFSNNPQRTVFYSCVKRRLPHSCYSRNFYLHSLNTVFECKQDLITCMKILNSGDIKTDITRYKANVHIKILKSYSFIFWLSFFSRIHPLVEILIGHL